MCNLELYFLSSLFKSFSDSIINWIALSDLNLLFSPCSGVKIKIGIIFSKFLIENYPIYYGMFKEKNFTWDRTGGDPIKQGNRNPLLYKNVGADGVKTGYLAVEKYSLASSIIKNDRRLIAVVSGFPSKIV